MPSPSRRRSQKVFLGDALAGLDVPAAVEVLRQQIERHARAFGAAEVTPASAAAPSASVRAGSLGATHPVPILARDRDCEPFDIIVREQVRAREDHLALGPRHAKQMGGRVGVERSGVVQS